MDFIINIVQLGVEEYISNPQQQQQLPLRATVFLNCKHIFNHISRKELMAAIAGDYSELPTIENPLLYSNPGTVHYHWKDGL